MDNRAWSMRAKEAYDLLYNLQDDDKLGPLASGMMLLLERELERVRIELYNKARADAERHHG